MVAGQTVSFNVAFVVEECRTCRMLFAVTAAYQNDKKADHKSFCCPAGHSQYYTGETDADRLRKEKEQLERSLQAKVNEARHAQLVAEKERNQVTAEKKRMEARAAAGLCLCCNRTFEDLARHMESKHAGVLGPGKEQKRLAGDVVARDLRDTELDLRAFNSLSQAGITTVAQLTAVSKEELLRLRWFGPAALRSVNAELKRLGLPTK